MNEEIDLAEFAPWLVILINSYTDPKDLFPPALATKLKLSQTREFYGG